MSPDVLLTGDYYGVLETFIFDSNVQAQWHNPDTSIYTAQFFIYVRLRS